jgi:hypothetical protein
MPVSTPDLVIIGGTKARSRDEDLAFQPTRVVN